MNYIEGATKKYTISQSDCFRNMLCQVETHVQSLEPDDIQNRGGVYIFWDWSDTPIRIGKARKLRNRIISYDTNHRNYYVYKKMYPHIQYVSVIYTKTRDENYQIRRV